MQCRPRNSNRRRWLSSRTADSARAQPAFAMRSQNPHLPPAMRPAASPVKVTGEVKFAVSRALSSMRTPSPVRATHVSPHDLSRRERRFPPTPFLTGTQSRIFSITGCRGHPCRRKRETHRGFHCDKVPPVPIFPFLIHLLIFTPKIALTFAPERRPRP